jgi:hypothetical protein
MVVIKEATGISIAYITDARKLWICNVSDISWLLTQISLISFILIRLIRLY